MSENLKKRYVFFKKDERGVNVPFSVECGTVSAQADASFSVEDWCQIFEKAKRVEKALGQPLEKASEALLRAAKMAEDRATAWDNQGVGPRGFEATAIANILYDMAREAKDVEGIHE